MKKSNCMSKQALRVSSSVQELKRGILKELTKQLTREQLLRIWDILESQLAYFAKGWHMHSANNECVSSADYKCLCRCGRVIQGLRLKVTYTYYLKFGTDLLNSNETYIAFG